MRRFTVALTACASVMGVIIPPSILMVVWGGVISVSIGGLFLAGVVPGVMIGLSLMVVRVIYAKMRELSGLRAGVPRASSCAALGRALAAAARRRRSSSAASSAASFTPTEASVRRGALRADPGRPGLPVASACTAISDVFYESARFAAISLFCIGTASAFGWLLAYFHVPQLFVDAGLAAGAAA